MNYKSLFATGSISFLLLVLVASLATASNSGSIWTTTSSCFDPVDANHYAVGEVVYLHGSNFDANTSLGWDITGNPGGSSCPYPNSTDRTVASGIIITNSSGAFCFAAHNITSFECGEYQATVDKNKHDNYRIDNVPLVPEFSLTIGILTILAASTAFFIIRRK